MTAPTPDPDCPMCEGAEPVVVKGVVQHCEGCSEPVDDPADWATCDEHEATYLIGEACPEPAPTEAPAQCPHCETAFDPPIAGGITSHTEYDCSECEGPVCWSCMDRVGDCPKCAPTETPSLTAEQARGLASRWSEARSVEAMAKAARSDLGLAMRLSLTGAELSCQLLTNGEREQLFAWARAFVLAQLGADETAPLGAISKAEIAEVLGDVLGLDLDGIAEETPAWRLIDASDGWPS